MSIEFQIYRRDGSLSIDRFTLENPAFDIEPHDHSIYLAVKAEMTNSRQGTSSTKTRGEVSGGGRKPWRQKGTGRARAGSIRSPIWVGGGVAFGPKPKQYSMKINKKVKNLARRSALAYKYREGKIVVVEDFDLGGVKSKYIREMLKALHLEGEKVTILASNIDKNLSLSCRNFYNIFLKRAEDASTCDILDCDTLLIDRSGLERLNDSLLRRNRE